MRSRASSIQELILELVVADEEDVLLHHAQRRGSAVPRHRAHRHDALARSHRASLPVDFGRRFIESRDARAVKADPEFIRAARGDPAAHPFGAPSEAASRAAARQLTPGSASSALGRRDVTPVLGTPSRPGTRARSTRDGPHHQGLQRARRRPEHADQRRHRVAACSLLWWVATHYGWIQRSLPADAGEDLHELRRSVAAATSRAASRLSEHFWWSLFRVFAAFLLACVTAVPIGIAMGVSRIARGIFDPPIEFYRPLPPLAYLPLIVIWFGIDETAKIVLIYLACFAPLAMAARAGVRSVTHRADQRRLLDGRVEMAGDLPRHHPRRDAGDPDRNAHRDRLRLDDARGRGNGRGHRRASARWCSTRRTSCAPTS